MLTATIIASATLVTGSQLSAQSKPQVREGFWITAGLGGGSVGCDLCDSRETGATAQIALGGTLSPRL